jgi:molecular chaperone GrpE
MPGRSRARPWRRWTLVEQEPEGDEVSLEAVGSKAADESAMAAKERRIEELTGDLKRVQADFENFKKRTEKEWAERSKMTTQRLMTDLLAVLDSFDKALEDKNDSEGPELLRNGLEGLHRQLLQVLQREGLREINTEGRFDPFLHEALMREEREDVEDGQILEVYQKGYLIGSRPIRPARVKVAKGIVPADKSERDELQYNQGTESLDSGEREDEER